MRAILTSRHATCRLLHPQHRAFYSPLPTRRGAGPRGGRARPSGQHSRVLKPSEEEQHAVDATEAELRQPQASGSRWTPPYPSTGRGDTNFDWTGYESIPNATKYSANADDSTLPAVDVVDDPSGVLRTNDPVARLLGQPAIAVVRQLEMMNLFIGYEQANRYRLLTPAGETVGYLAEEEQGLGSALIRQAAGTHRAMKATVMDVNGREVLRMRRPFSFINSRIYVERLGEEGEEAVVIGEAQQQWHPWRRKYNLFYRRPNDAGPPPSTSTESSSSTAVVPADNASDDHHFAQFASINSGLWAWDFYPTSENGSLLASINRNFAGFMREIFTDTGQMVIRFEAVEDDVKMLADAQSRKRRDIQPDVEGKASSNQYAARTFSKDTQNDAPSSNLPATLPNTLSNFSSLTLDQRAVILATAVSIDFDYFTRDRGGLFTPPLILGGFGGGGAPQPAPGTAGAGTEAGTAAGVGMMEGARGGDYDERSAGRTGGADGAPPPQTGQSEGAWSEAPLGEWSNGEEINEGEALNDPWGAKGGGDSGSGWFGGWGSSGGDSGGGWGDGGDGW